MIRRRLANEVAYSCTGDGNELARKREACSSHEKCVALHERVVKEGPTGVRVGRGSEKKGHKLRSRGERLRQWDTKKLLNRHVA